MFLILTFLLLFWQTPQTLLLVLFWNKNILLVGILWNISPSTCLLQRLTTLLLNMNFWVVFLLCNVGAPIWLANSLSCWLITSLSFIYKPNLVSYISRLIGLMLCYHGMCLLFVPQVAPILLLMHCLIVLLFLFLTLLILLSYLTLLDLFVSGMPHCFNGGWY